MKEYIAHVRKKDNGTFEIQTMQDHLAGVAEFASSFARKFKNENWGRIIGLLHDIGKYSTDFQEYIKKNSGYEEDDQKLPKTDHTSAGAIFAKEKYPQFWPPLAYCVAGHHAGLHNYLPEIGISGDLRDRLTKLDFLEKVRLLIPKEIQTTTEINQPTGQLMQIEHYHLWIRMLYSCLVDADYLDTDRFMNPEKYGKRGKYIQLIELKKTFDVYMDKLTESATQTNVNIIRQRILKQCIESGSLTPGFFSITVPTGGGKTLSSMAWALEHAKKYNKSRIIFVIPYTSIIVQTAQVYRDIFGEDNVVEHHSNIDEDSSTQESKLAIENWDAPIIVTTNVEFFESLYANKSSRCRKLHNICNSIVILDEAQMLPPEFLKPIVSVLKGLVNNFGVSVLFSTATQPVLSGTIGGSGKNSFVGIEKENVREIVEDFEQLVTDLQRVKLKTPENNSQISEWTEIAKELSTYEQVLCIVNTRKDCRELYKLMPSDTIHLSRMMCTAHIMETIKTIKEKLKRNEPVRVVSTQLIEAGVDVDFPIVYRALAGLDSIAQSAGRCNREGKLNKEGKLGLTKVFMPKNGTPPGLLRKGADMMRELLAIYQTETFLTPRVFDHYFRNFYGKIATFDKPHIKQLLWDEVAEMKFQFATAARDFKLIDDKGAQSIVVEYGDGANLINLLKRNGPENWLYRKMQRYTVTLNQRDFEEIRKAGLIEQIHGVWIQSNEILYNSRYGIMSNGQWLEEIHII